MSLTLKTIMKETWKRVPGVNLYYYLQGEFNDNPKALWPAFKQVIYASAIIGAVTYFGASKLDSHFQKNQTEINSGAVR